MNADAIRKSKYHQTHLVSGSMIDQIPFDVKSHLWFGLDKKDGVYIQFAGLPVCELTDEQAICLKQALEQWFPE